MLPVEHTRIDVTDVRAEVVGANGKQQQPNEGKRQASRGDVQQGQENAKEHQRCPDLPRDEEHPHRRAPDQEQRTELLHRR